MEKALKQMLLLSGVMAVSFMMLFSCDSYERRMAKFEKIAAEYKTTLDSNNIIVAEKIDSVAQKVFYIEFDSPEYDPTGQYVLSIKMHDYATGETTPILLPETGSIEDFQFCDEIYGYCIVEYFGSKLYEDRLFIKLRSGSMWELGAMGVFYINILDNSLHYVVSCDSADFLDNDEIFISKFYFLGFLDEDEEWRGDKTERKQYLLSTRLSAETYAANRREQKKEEERLAEEWRKRDIDRVIEFDYTIDQRNHYVDYAGTLDGQFYTDMMLGDRVFSKRIVVPQGKVWQLKRASHSGYSEWHAPSFIYHKVINGYLEPPGGKIFRNAEILYSGTYKFSIKDTGIHMEGRRIAKLVFTEQEY